MRNYSAIEMKTPGMILYVLLLCTVIALKAPLPIATSGQYITNNDFHYPPLSGFAFIYNDNEAYPWIGKVIELANGTYFNPNVPLGTVACQLTPRNNVIISQALRIDYPMNLTLTFSWFPRSEYVSSGRGRLLWNNKEAAVLIAQNETVQLTTIYLGALAGINTLGFEGIGSATAGNGLFITNVSLVKSVEAATVPSVGAASP